MGGTEWGGGGGGPGLRPSPLDHPPELWRIGEPPSPLAGHTYRALHFPRGLFLDKITLKAPR